MFFFFIFLYSPSFSLTTVLYLHYLLVLMTRSLLTLSLSFSLCLCLSFSHTHMHSLSLSLSHTHTHMRAHTHTHTRTTSPNCSSLLAGPLDFILSLQRTDICNHCRLGKTDVSMNMKPKWNIFPSSSLLSKLYPAWLFCLTWIVYKTEGIWIQFCWVFQYFLKTAPIILM